MDPLDSIPVSASLGRSFMATHGRTSTEIDLLALESVVGPGPHARRDHDRLTFERRAIHNAMAPSSLSIPEVAGACSLPLLAAQLLVSEMLLEGLLTVVAAAATTEIDLRALHLIREKIESL